MEEIRLAYCQQDTGNQSFFIFYRGCCSTKSTHAVRFSSASIINPVVVVVCPLNSLITDQIRRSTEGKVKATILNVKRSRNSDDDVELALDSSQTNSLLLKEAK